MRTLLFSLPEVRLINFFTASGGVFSANLLSQGSAASGGEFNPERLNKHCI
jgi:hypothetical protein